MKKRLFILFFIFIFFFSSLVFADDFNDNEIIDVNSEIIESISSNSNIKIPNINSRSCVIIDRKTNCILYGKNENEKRKMASTTKIMTACIIIENCDLNSIVEISKKAANTSGSKVGLKFGDKVSVKDLLYGLMLCSGNDAAVALAEYSSGNIQNFSKLMNDKAHELGLINTNFETPHGLDSENHYTTAYELAKLTNYALNNKIFSEIVNTKNYTIYINNAPKQLRNTNELLGVVSGVYGVKTGFTNGANRCLVTACKRNDMDIIVVVLGADTKKFRGQDSIKLINYIFDNFTPINIKKIINDEFQSWKNKNLNTFRINKGVSNNIELEIKNIDNDILNTDNLVIPIKKDSINDIKINIDCKKDFEAPIYKNSNIGNINVYISKYLGLNYNIYTTNEIKRKNWLNYSFEILKNYSNIISIDMF